MAYVSRLYNPTPWDEAIEWGNRGVKIRVPAFGHADLTHEQMHDFRENNPGSESVLDYLNFFGIFLYDADRPYDNQALDALKKAYSLRKERYDAQVRNISSERSKAGLPPDPDALEEQLRILGVVAFREKMETLKKLVEKLEANVGPDRAARPKLDPARTIFVTDPPREFPSVSAMEFFLELNPDVKAKHEAFKAQSGAQANA